MSLYVLTHEYFDRSGFSVNGVTSNCNVAKAWFEASDETNVYEVIDPDSISHWMSGLKGWREKEKEEKK